MNSFVVPLPSHLFPFQMVPQLQLYLPSGKLIHVAPFKHGFKLQAFPAGENIFKLNSRRGVNGEKYCELELFMIMSQQWGKQFAKVRYCQMELSSYGHGEGLIRYISRTGSPMRELTKEPKVFVERNSRLLSFYDFNSSQLLVRKICATQPIRSRALTHPDLHAGISLRFASNTCNSFVF